MNAPVIVLCKTDPQHTSDNPDICVVLRPVGNILPLSLMSGACEMDTPELKLRRRSLDALIRHLQPLTDSIIRQRLFKHGLDGRYEGQNKLARLGAVFHPLAQEQPDASEMKGAIQLLEEIAGDLEAGYSSEEELEDIKQALRVDGLDLVEGRIAPFLTPHVQPEVEQGLLEARLSSAGFEEPLNRFSQSVDNAARSQWESANGDIRTFLDSLCGELAARLYPGTGKPPTGGAARQFLQDQGFLNKKEADLLKSLFSVLHGEGPHPGTSSSDDCHRRRLMVVSLANYYLDRFLSPQQ